MTPTTIIAFWQDAGRKAWFAKTPEFDAAIRRRFTAAHHAAARGELAFWADNAEGALALLLLLDQFPRNLWRGSAHAFATDPLARSLARSAVDDGHDRSFPAPLRSFFYLPFEHSEALADQDLAVHLCEALERETGENADWARKHRDIIVRFGRFPHRNRILGRTSTPEELAFLAEGGFAG